MLIDFRELFPRWGIKPKGVLHVGANVGEEAPVYDELGIKKVVWVEPNQKLRTKLYDNTVKKYGHSNLYFCAGDENKDGTLHVSNNGGQSSSILELGTHKIAHPDVCYTEDQAIQIKRLDNHFAEWGGSDDLDFINVDVQGAELKVLKGMGDLLKQFKWAYLEVNKEELYKGCALIDSVDLFMIANGFRRVETKWCGNTGWGDALYIR